MGEECVIDGVVMLGLTADSSAKNKEGQYITVLKYTTSALGQNLKNTTSVLVTVVAKVTKTVPVFHHGVK